MNGMYAWCIDFVNVASWNRQSNDVMRLSGGQMTDNTSPSRNLVDHVLLVVMPSGHAMETEDDWSVGSIVDCT
jgi:hypothetical protein